MSVGLRFTTRRRLPALHASRTQDVEHARYQRERSQIEGARRCARCKSESGRLKRFQTWFSIRPGTSSGSRMKMSISSCDPRLNRICSLLTWMCTCARVYVHVNVRERV